MEFVNCKAILFDMDGTLVDSARCLEAIWRGWAERHGIELDRILSILHGRRTLDTLREVAPHLDIAHEATLLDAEELKFSDGVRAVSGASELLRELPPSAWGVVTSTRRALAKSRLQLAGLPVPKVLVCADDVAKGKPGPEGFLKAATLLNEEPRQCLAVEDSPAGVLAAQTAGMQVIALSMTYPPNSFRGINCVRDFCHLRIAVVSESLEIQIH
jgi:sugar-phosphatase